RSGAPTGWEPSTASDTLMSSSRPSRCSAIRSLWRATGSSSRTIPRVTASPSSLLPIRRIQVGVRFSTSPGSGNQRACSLRRLGVGAQAFWAIRLARGGRDLNSYHAVCSARPTGQGHRILPVDETRVTVFLTGVAILLSGAGNILARIVAPPTQKTLG